MNTHLAPATASTTPPLKPTAADLALLAGAQEAELAARDLYDAAIAAAVWTDEQTNVLASLREAHEAYAQSLGAMLGVTAPGTASAAVTAAHEVAMTNSVGSDALSGARELEVELTALHSGLLGQLVAIDAAALVASILMAEGRHGTALAALSGATDPADLLGVKA